MGIKMLIEMLLTESNFCIVTTKSYLEHIYHYISMQDKDKHMLNI